MSGNLCVCVVVTQNTNQTHPTFGETPKAVVNLWIQNHRIIYGAIVPLRCKNANIPGEPFCGTKTQSKHPMSTMNFIKLFRFHVVPHSAQNPMITLRLIYRNKFKRLTPLFYRPCATHALKIHNGSAFTGYEKLAKKSNFLMKDCLNWVSINWQVASGDK